MQMWQIYTDSPATNETQGQIPRVHGTPQHRYSPQYSGEAGRGWKRLEEAGRGLPSPFITPFPSIKSAEVGEVRKEAQPLGVACILISFHAISRPINQK